MLPPSPAFVGSLLGTMKAGAVPLIGAPDDVDALARCVDATRPAAAIVHESRLQDVSRALAALPRERVVVVGAETHGHPSFVDAMRAQPSWLAPAPVAGDAPALRLWTVAGSHEIGHADLAQHVQGNAAERANERLTASPVAASVVQMLSAFSRGEPVALA
jgi:acyl-CoA synthetase (AMP-forming)/AMP-acid ligase II